MRASFNELRFTMKRLTLGILRTRLFATAAAMIFVSSAGFAFAHGHSGGGAHFSGGHVGVVHTGGGHVIGSAHGYVGHSPGGYVGGSHITSTPHFGSEHVSTHSQFNHPGAGHFGSSSYFTGIGSHASSHALSNHNFAGATHHGGINADRHHDGFHHHHHFFSFFPFAFGAFSSAYPYYYGNPYSYGDPCDRYSPDYDPAYCEWLYSQGYYGNGSQYQPAPSTLPSQQNRYPRQQRDDANKNAVSSTTNPSGTIAFQSLANQSESADDVDLDEAPAEYTAAIRAPLLAATSAPEALPQQPARAK